MLAKAVYSVRAKLYKQVIHCTLRIALKIASASFTSVAWRDSWYTCILGQTGLLALRPG